ncbi:alpha/beta hydrolase [Shinella curvata]|uniref:Alpha/beta hydrolase n=1 Tax=Shinella curvata TaxID=1817964 RepID=A0ABT8XDR4_9HYPH|nr:alpha/beta hydrolase [Shinella curvata]MCJ8055467.1 alpha/beta hydrolase [Shinella curvata]MDO6121884.1 alpha/beta hydrolase [Shinella curvata]
MLTALLATPFALALSGYAFTAWKARAIEQQFPNVGEMIDVSGFRLNSVLVPAGVKADLPPIVFIHGASGNLRDQMHAFRAKLEGRAALLFVDRPGHGYSERGGPENAWPDGQANAIARLMEKRGIDKAIIVAHSFGGAIAASFALEHPEKTAGLLFLAPATHPWPGGVDWYYDLARAPFVGWLFTRIVALPVGLSRIESGTRFVFAPNPRPNDYIDATAPALVLRPAAFRNNATDVANLLEYVRRVQLRYHEIHTPTVIVTGDTDGVVYEEIHSRGLARDIDGSELVWIHNLGHKPDYVVTDLAVEAIEQIAGAKRDLQESARRAEARLAKDHEK